MQSKHAQNEDAKHLSSTKRNVNQGRIIAIYVSSIQGSLVLRTFLNQIGMLREDDKINGSKTDWHKNSSIKPREKASPETKRVSNKCVDEKSLKIPISFVYCIKA